MKNVLLSTMWVLFITSCHPRYVYLKQGHAKHIKGTNQVMMVPEQAEYLRFDRNQIHLTSEKNGVTFFMSNSGPEGRGIITYRRDDVIKKYKYKITQTPYRK